MTSSHAAGAAVLQSCPAAQPEQGTHASIVTQADGTRLRISVSAAAQPGCRSIPLPVAPDDVAAIHPVSPAVAAALGDQVLLQGPEKDGRFMIASASGTAAAPPRVDVPTPMPLRENLLPDLSVRSFGVEERIRAQLSDGKLHLQCAPGSKPAGVILSAPWTLTQAQAALQLKLQRGGSGRYEVQVQDAAGAASGSALALGHLDAALAQEQQIALPRAGIDRMRWRSFSIACPMEKSELLIEDMRLLPRAPSGAAAPGRSTWIWQPADWQQPEKAGRMFAHAERHGIRTLFISVPVKEGAVAEPGRLSDFIRDAARRGIEVWSVDGDPYMVLPDEHAASVQRVRAYAAYNRSVPPQARLGGLQFDVEHYLVAGYELAAPALDRHYLALAAALHRAAAGLPLEFVVPFWWAGKTELLKSLAMHASGLTVMDYRTDPGQILRFGAPFLDWAAIHGKRVRIALEAGPVEAEWQRRYVKAAGGQLWLVKLDQTPVLVLLKREQTPPAGAQAYRFAADRLLDGSATTFHRDPARMLSLLPSLEADFAAWPGFGGIALHELKQR